MVGNTNALTIQGSLWTPASESAQDPGIVPTYSATATFTVDALNFDSRRGTETYDDFLKGSTTENINNLTWLTWDSLSYTRNDFYTANGEGSFFQFTGTAYFDADTTIIHDDGFYLTLGNTIYDYSTPTAPTPHSLGNAAGNYNFTMNYGAWNGFPEVLLAPMSNPVPEPGTMLLLGLGILGLAGIGRKKKIAQVLFK